MDRWGLDVVGSGSRRVNDAAWPWLRGDEASGLESPGTLQSAEVLFHLATYRKAAAKDSNPFTPPVNALLRPGGSHGKMMQAEGLEAIFCPPCPPTRAARRA